MPKHNFNPHIVSNIPVLFLSSHPEVRPEHLAHVDMFMCAAAPLPLADVDRLFTKAQVRMIIL